METLPVDPRRLKSQFPDLTDEDLAAYAEITRRVLRDPARKGRVMREVMDLARSAREKGTGAELSRDEALALGYLRAVEKMQASTARPR
jgi:hypothetical protein